MVIFHADHKQVILDHCVSSLQNFLFFSLWNEHEPVHQQHVKKLSFKYLAINCNVIHGSWLYA